MNDDVPKNNVGCARYRDDLAELALGVLTGRDRARALSHVDECPRCAEELEQLSRIADTVLQVAPEVEPPIGFESRLFERMGVSDSARRPRRLRVVSSLGSMRPRHWVPAAIAAAAALAALGFGLSTTSAPSATQAKSPIHHPRTMVAGDFVENGQTVGHVVAAGGSRPWMSMMLEDSTAQGLVQCVVVTRDGVTHDVGTFVARQGYGAWVAPLQLDPKDLWKAEVVTPDGAVIATATLT